MNVTELVAELLPIAESLFVLIDKIKTNAPDAWASVGQEYVAAVQAWKDAKDPATHPPTAVANVLTIVPEPTKDTLIGSAPAPHTLSTVEQTALRLPPANYTP